MMHSRPGSKALAALVAPHTPVARVARGAFETIAVWLERDRQRRALAELDGRLLKDVGITPDQAAREVAKPFWR